MLSIKLFKNLLFLVCYALAGSAIAQSKAMMTCKSIRYNKRGAVIQKGNFGYKMTYGESRVRKIFSCGKSQEFPPMNKTPWLPILDCTEYDDSKPFETTGLVGVIRKNKNAYLLSIERRTQVAQPGGNPFYPDMKTKRKVLDVLKCHLNR